MRQPILLLILLLTALAVKAQKTCVIANAEDHVPIKEAIIHTDNNHWARTDYRGYFNMKYAFDSATVSKPGFLKTTIYLENLPDTVFMLPESHQISEVEVWGKNQEHIDQMEQNIQDKVNEQVGGNSGISMDMLGWMDRRGNRDRKHLKQAKGILSDYEKKDPIVSAYEKVTGKKVKKEEENTEKEKGGVPEVENEEVLNKKEKSEK